MLYIITKKMMSKINVCVKCDHTYIRNTLYQYKQTKYHSNTNTKREQIPKIDFHISHTINKKESKI